MDKIILTGKQYKDYQNEEVCFGSKEEGMCFDPTETQCKHCSDSELCEKLFNADSTVKIVNADTADVTEVFDNPEETVKTVETSVETEENTANQAEREVYTKESLTDKILLIGKENGVDFTVTKLKTRNKVFIGDVQAFTITDQTIRIYDVVSGKALGLMDGEWSEKTNGILVEMEKSSAIGSVLLNYFEMDKTAEPEEEFKTELDLEQSTEVIKEKAKEVQKIPVENPVANNVTMMETPTSNRSIIGGIAVNVYSDETVEISATVLKSRFDTDKVMDKMKELLEDLLGE